MLVGKNQSIRVIDNSHGLGNARSSTLEDLPLPPDPKDLHARLKGVLNEAYKNGTISRRIYEATLGGQSEAEVGM